MYAVRKKLLISLLTIAFFSAAVLTQTAKASPGIIVEIVPSTDIVLPGEQFYVNVSISNIEASHDLVGIEFQIVWNTTLVYATSIDLPPGHIFQAAEDDDNLWVIRKVINSSDYPDTAWYLVTCSSLEQGYNAGYLPLTGSGIIAKITFNATDGIGNSTIQFKELPPTNVKIKLSNGAGQQITDYIVIDSSIEVIPEFSNSFLLMIVLMFSLIVVVIYKNFQKSRCLL